MKALWILNSPIGTAARVLGYSHAASGTWIAAAESRLKALLPELTVDYAVLGYQDRVVTDEATGCKVYELSIKQSRGKRSPGNAVKQWKTVIKQEAPNLIHVWGTEFTFPLDVMDACGEIPVAVTIQGMVASLAKYCRSDVPFGALMKGHRILAFPAYLRARQKEREMIRQVRYEKEILIRANAVLVDNEWTEAYCSSVSQNIESVYFPLAINQSFGAVCWSFESCEKETLFTIAPSSSMKGMHMLLQALAIVKRSYPNVKLRIPGSFGGGRLSTIKEPPYFRYLKRLIKELDLVGNVKFCGKLTSEQMADELKRANVFVMPSKAENISTSLREAMWVGCPCVVSLVGAVHELVCHGYNALCYRYEEYEVLAAEILRILASKELAEQISRNANETISKSYPINPSLNKCVDWYQKAVKKKL
jgi:glycosyltransferase involved in cell wall biosynthesis